MKKITFLVMALVAPWLMAQDSDGPTVDGAVQMNIAAEGDIDAAVGNEANATQALGSIQSGNLVGDVELGIQASGDINAAVGNESCADQQIGTIGEKSTC